VHKILVFCEPVAVPLQRCNQNFVFVYGPYKLAIAVEMENAALCAYHYRFRSSFNWLAAKIAFFPCFH